MKAIVARGFGPVADLAYADWPEPEATGDRVVIEAAAIGVNFPDGLLVEGRYQVKPTPPFVPGMEVAGRVLAVGPAVRTIRPGDQVAALLSLGGYAERVAAPERALTRLPDGIDPAHACALLCGYGTAHHALRQRARLAPGETLCVLGAAGLTGLAAVEIGKTMGARVIAVASSEDKQALALAHGAEEAAGYGELRDTLKRFTDGRGIDVAFDPVGGDSFEPLARSMAWNGRLLIVGFAAGTIPALPMNLPLVKGFSAVGVFWGAFIEREPEAYAANMTELMGWYRSGAVRPVISGSYPLAEAPAVLARVLAGGGTGKLILTP